MTLHWPQFIYLCFTGLAGGFCMALDGQPRRGDYSFGGWVIAQGLLLLLLWWGGFFNGH